MATPEEYAELRQQLLDMTQRAECAELAASINAQTVREQQIAMRQSEERRAMARGGA